jgi:hypothetical protein
MWKKIVSANYRDREDATNQGRWLIRDFEQAPREAVEVKQVIATNVAFCPSSAWETGFGCTTVAFCEAAEVQTEELSIDALKEQGFVKLRFEGYRFFNRKTHVETCQQLLLRSDGSMYAIV